MIEILNDFRNYHFLFPDTNLYEFDEYVERIFSVKVTSQFVKRALKNEKFSNSVKTLYNSISIAHNLNFNSDFLRTLYTIREQTESYPPLILNITRPGCDYKRWLGVPPFMFAGALYDENERFFKIPRGNQKIEINDKILIDRPFITLEQLHVKTGDNLTIYNSFRKGPNTLDLNIQHVGNASIEYLKDDKIKTLKSDISFLTRIPFDTLKLSFTGVELTDDNLSLEECWINEGDLIDVDTSFQNEPFNVTLTFSDESDSIELSVTPITKIITMMRLAKLNNIYCSPMYNDETLSFHKAFVDYNIVGPTTIFVQIRKQTDN